MWAATEASVQELTDSGFESFGNGDYTSAVRYFEQVLARDPNNDVAKLALERSKKELSTQKKQEKKEERKSSGENLTQGTRLYQTGDVTAAIDSFREILATDPKNKKAQKSLNDIRTKTEEKLGNETKDTPQWNLDQGTLAYLDGDWSRAFDFFQEARRLEPDNEMTQEASERAQEKLLTMVQEEQLGFYRESAKAFYDQGLYQQALTSWQRVMEMRPEDSEARNGIKQSDEALARLQNKVRSEDVILMIEKALSLYASRKWQESLREWERIQKTDPSVESAREYIVKIKGKLAELAKATAQIKAPSTAPWRAARKPTAVTVLPPTLTSTEENFPEAIRNMEIILKKDPSNIKVAQALEKAKSRQKELADKYYKDGLISYSQGKLPDAIRQWQIVLRIDPDHAKARQAILKAQAESGT